MLTFVIYSPWFNNFRGQVRFGSLYLSPKIVRQRFMFRKFAAQVLFFTLRAFCTTEQYAGFPVFDKEVIRRQRLVNKASRAVQDT